MPPVIVGIAAGVAAAGVVSTAAAIAIGIGAAALTYAATPKFDSGSFANEAFSQQQMLRSPVEPRRGIYGRAMVSGPLVFAEETGTDNAYLHLVIPLAGHRCDGIEKIYFGDEVAWSNGVMSSKYATFARLKIHLGNQTTSDPNLTTECSQWTSAHVGFGVTYLYARLKFDTTVFPNGVPNIKALVRGKRIYDPRKTTHNWNAPETWEWSDNWALCCLDYNRFESGVGAAAHEIDVSYFAAAANDSDQLVEYKTGKFEKRYTCNGTYNQDVSPSSIMEKMLTAGAGMHVYVSGQYRLYAGVYQGPEVLVLTEDDAAGDIDVRPYTPRSDLCNAVRGTFVDPENFYQPTDFPPYESSYYRAQDDGEYIDHDLDLPFTQSVWTAQRLGKLYLEQKRAGMQISMPVKMIGVAVSVGKVVGLSLPRLGIDGTFQIVDWQFDYGKPVSLILVETSPELFDYAMGSYTERDLTPNVILPNPATVPTPVGLQYLEYQDDPQWQGELTWSAPANNSSYRYVIEVSNGLGEVVYQTNADATRLQLPKFDTGFYTVSLWALNLFANRSNVPATITIGATLPAPVTGIEVIAGPLTLTLRPTTAAQIAQTTQFEILGSITNNIAEAALIGTGKEAVWPDRHPNTRYHVWARTINNYGVSSWYGSVEATTSADNSSIIDLIGNTFKNYTWFAWADDNQGTGFTTVEALGDGKAYMGLATDKETASPSGNWQEYTWTKIKADIGPVFTPEEEAKLDNLMAGKLPFAPDKDMLAAQDALNNPALANNLITALSLLNQGINAPALGGETPSGAQSKASSAQSAAIAAAATDATTKANNAKAQAEVNAALDALNKANTAKSDAITTAASDATTKANNAKAAAESYALAKANLAETTAKAYADGIVSDEEARAIADAQAKADAAKAAAIAAAAADATSKANNAKAQAEANAALDALNKANTAKADAISTASTDATTKANNAKTQAVSSAATDATTKADAAKAAAIAAAATDATTKANNAKAQAEVNAALDALNKANTAKSDAITTAASDATTKANNAKAAAESYALAKANLAETTAKAYADGIVSDEEARAIADAQAKADAAKAAAIAAAAADATSKANNAKAQAEANAALDALNKANTAKADAISTASTDATTKANNAKTQAVSSAATDATTKADAAKAAAIAAAAADATTKANNAKAQAEASAALDALNKANTAKADAISTAATDAQAKASAAQSAAIAASAPAYRDQKTVEFGAFGDYQYRVIPICRVIQASDGNSNPHMYTTGKLVFKRTSGNGQLVEVFVNAQCGFSSYWNMFDYEESSNVSGVSPVTFFKNGVQYFGVAIKVPAQFQRNYFVGSHFDGFGDSVVFSAITYFTANNSAIIDSEIYNSITDYVSNRPTKSNSDYIVNGNKLETETGSQTRADSAKLQAIGDVAAGNFAAQTALITTLLANSGLFNQLKSRLGTFGGLTAETIAALAIATNHLQAGAVTADKITADIALIQKLIANVGLFNQLKAQLASFGGLTADTIAALAIATNHLQAGSVTVDKVGANAITADKIAALAIATNHLQAGSVTVDKVGANAITAEKIAALAIATNHLQAGAVTVDKVSANAITAEKIAALAIATNHLQAGVVTADKITADTALIQKLIANVGLFNQLQAQLGMFGGLAANSIAAKAITASHLVVTGGGTINYDPMLLDSDSWGSTSGSFSFFELSDAPAGKRVLRSNGVISAYPYDKNYYPIDTSKTYRFRFWARSAAGTNGKLYACLKQYSSISVPCANNGGRAPYKPGAVNVPTTWTEYSFQWGAGDWQAGVKYVVLDWLLNHGGSAGYMEICYPRFEEMAASELIVDGAITTQKILSKAITTDKIAANAVTANEILADTALINKLVATSALFDSLVARLAVFGGITTNAIAAGAVTAEKVNVTAQTSSSGVYTSFKLKPADPTPLRLSEVAANGALIEDIFYVDRAGNGFFRGILSKDTVDIQSIQDTARKQINPFYLGTTVGNKQEILTTATQTSGATTSLPAVVVNGGTVNVTYKYAGGSSQSYSSFPPISAIPQWRVDVYRGSTAGALVHSKVFTGTRELEIEAEINWYQESLGISIEGSFTDTGAATSQVYVAKVTAVNTSLSSITRRYLGAESPNFLTNTMLKSANGWWRDKETGLILQWGTDSFNANAVKTITLPTSFPTLCAFAGANSMENNAAADPAQVYAKALSTISIINGANIANTVTWFALGY